MERPSEDLPRDAGLETRGKRRRGRVAVLVRVGHRMAVGLLWAATVLLAAIVGWSVGHFGEGDELWDAWVALLRPADGGANVDAGLPAAPPTVPTVLPPVTPAVPAEPAVERPPAKVPEPVEKPPKPKPKPKPVEPIEPIETPPPVVEPEPAPAPPPALVRTREAETLAGAGKLDRAAERASAVLADYTTYSGLTAALREEGADELGSRLTSLRMLQLAGHDEIARDVAREMRLAYTGTPTAADAIRDWGILKPLIRDVESTVQDGRGLLVEGTVENPDVVRVRKLRVQVDALDAAGNVLSSEEARVRPKALEPSERGRFDVEFRGIDPGRIIRTRTTVVAWESAILGS